MRVWERTRSVLVQGLSQLLVLALLGHAAMAQERASTAPAEDEDSGGEYRIGAGDVLSIEVTGIATEKVRVSNSGKVHLTLLGILRVAGLTPGELRLQIARLLVERQLIKDPWVIVRVTDYLSQPVYILGEVELPGQYAIKGEMYLNDLISMANGPTELASPVVYLYRRKANADTLSHDESPAEEAITIDLDALNTGRKPEHNYKLRGGDILYIPQATDDYFFVVGDVKAPARYALGRGGLLASRALVLAGGPLTTAKLRRAVLVRVDETGNRREIPLDLDGILRGRTPDVPVQTGDVVYVPGSRTKSLAYAMTAVIPGTVVGGLRRLPR